MFYYCNLLYSLVNFKGKAYDILLNDKRVFGEIQPTFPTQKKMHFLNLIKVLQQNLIINNITTWRNQKNVIKVKEKIKDAHYYYHYLVFLWNCNKRNKNININKI